MAYPPYPPYPPYGVPPPPYYWCPPPHSGKTDDNKKSQAGTENFEGIPPGYYPPPPPPPHYYYPSPPPYMYPQRPTNYSYFAGIILIISGIINIAIAIIALIFITWWGNIVEDFYMIFPGSILVFCTALPLLAGILGLTGGYFAMQKKFWGFTLSAAIIILIVVLIIGSVLALVPIIAILLLLIGKNEFES